MLNLSDKCLGIYCTVCMSQDLMRRQKPLKYLKQGDLRQGISHTGDGRLRTPAENPEIRARYCQPPAGLDGWRDNTRRCCPWSPGTRVA